jgi:hypothetical protein
MSTKIELLRKFIREIVKQELQEASVTANLDGGEGPPKTPYAFQGKRKKDKEKENKIATNSTGYSKVNEGKYHDYRNDESLTARQKIGYSMREIRDHLVEIDKLTKMNVRLKTEMGVDSRSYWKNTHKAMRKISERLVKLANKIGKLY